MKMLKTTTLDVAACLDLPRACPKLKKGIIGAALSTTL